MGDGISFTILARDLASRAFREVGREALAMAAKVQAANRAMDQSFFKGGHSQFEMWAKAIIAGLPLIPPLIVAVGVALAGLNSILMSAIPGVGILAAAFIANFKAIKASQPFTELTNEWHKFAAATRADIMRPVTVGIQILTDLMGRAVPIVHAFSSVLTGFLQHLKQEMASPAFDKFLAWVRTVGAANFGSLLRSIENLVVGLAHLGMAFSTQGLNITKWLEDTTAKFRTWAANLTGSGGIGGFINYFERTWPHLKTLVGELFTALSHIIQAVAPLSVTFMDFFSLLLKGFNSIPIPILTKLIQAFIGLKAAAYGFAAAQAAVNIAMAANPIGAVLVAIAALVAAFVVAYNTSSKFRNAVKDAFHQIGAAAHQLLVAAKPVIDWFKSPQGAAAMGNAMKLAATAVRVSATILAAAIRNISVVARPVFAFVAQQARLLGPVFAAMGRAIQAAVNVARNAFNLMRAGFQAVGNVVRTVAAAIRAANAAIGATFRALGAIISSVGARIRSILQTVGAAWRNMVAIMRTVPQFGWISSLIGLLGRIVGAAAAAAGAVRGLIGAIGSIPSLPSISLPHFAAGGRPPVGKVALVGEKGPELFIPDGPGTIVPAAETAKMIGHSGDGAATAAQAQSGDVTALLEELRSIRQMLGRLPHTYVQLQRMGGTA